MFPQMNMTGINNNGYSTSSQQNNSLLGNQQFLPQNQPTAFNTTAPSSSTNVHPSVQNMIKALKGGM